MVCLSLVACATKTETQHSVYDSAHVDLVFLDIDSSDKKISDAMAKSSESIEITFGGKQVTTVDIPTRLQHWLSAAEDSGKGISIRNTDGTQVKSLGAVVALIPAGIKFIKDAYKARLVKNYQADVYVSPTTGIIEKVVFVR
jgi:hypothetical protein